MYKQMIKSFCTYNRNFSWCAPYLAFNVPRFLAAPTIFRGFSTSLPSLNVIEMKRFYYTSRPKLVVNSSVENIIFNNNNTIASIGTKIKKKI